MSGEEEGTNAADVVDVTAAAAAAPRDTEEGDDAALLATAEVSGWLGRAKASDGETLPQSPLR